MKAFNYRFQTQFFNHPEGYVKNDNGVFNYVYQFKDHLGNVRVSYADAAKTYQKIIDSNFETSFDGWQQNGTVNYTLVNGRLKANVQQNWEGIRYDYTGAIPGQPYTVKIKFDKANTQANVRFYVSYDHTNGTHAGYHMFSNSLQTGEYTFTYTPVSNTGNIRIHLDKDNTNTSTETQFYVDYITFTKGKLEIIEESNYYPFGLKHKGYNNVTTTFGNSVGQKYKYNGVEFEESLGLNLYEMDFRMYDPAIGRFNGIDPVTHHSQGTSLAFDNNPIYFADPSGADAIYNDETGEYVINGMPLVFVNFDNTDDQENTNKFNYEPNYTASTVVNNKGEIIDYKDDGDDNIYLNERSTENIIGKEREGINYSTGDYLTRYDLNDDAYEKLPVGFLLKFSKDIDIKPTELYFWPAEVLNGGLIKVGSLLSKIKWLKWGKKLYSDKMFKAFQNQLKKDGRGSLLRSQKKIQIRLNQHLKDLKKYKKEGGHTSSVEREINTFKAQLQAIKDVLKN